MREVKAKFNLKCKVKKNYPANKYINSKVIGSERVCVTLMIRPGQIFSGICQGETEMRAIWAGCQLRNDRIRAVMPITFRSLDESIRDCVEAG